MNEDTKLARWLNNEMNEAELAAFTASPGFETYRKIRDYSAQLTVPEADLDALYKNIQQEKNVTKVPRNNWIPKIAAILVIALGLTYFLYTTRTTTQFAEAGKHIGFILPDSSSVVLNAGSTAEYKPNKWDSTRKLELDGEAYFKVAKGKTFDVVTPLGTVTVVGTQFNVRARKDRFEVTCFEGKVKVASKTDVVYLLPGESIAFEKGNVISIPLNDIQQPGWLSYETSFTAELPENIISEIERQYDVTIEVTGAIERKTFTGTLPMNDIDTALEIFSTVYHLKTEKRGNKIIVSSE
jgi:transmembrane sensor